MGDDEGTRRKHNSIVEEAQIGVVDKELERGNQPSRSHCIVWRLAVACILFITCAISILYSDPGEDIRLWVDHTVEYMPVVAKHKLVRDNLYALDYKTMGMVRTAMEANNLTMESLEEESRALHDYIEKVKALSEPVFHHTPKSTGIVMSCRIGSVCVSNVMWLLKHLNTDVPVELWVEKSDPAQKVIKALAGFSKSRLHVRFLDDVFAAYTKAFGPVIQYDRPYHLKVMAIVASSFEKVLWVDSDAFILRNVSYIANQASSGTLFWHDTHKTHHNNPIWSLMNMTKPFNGLTQESGIIYIDKATKWRLLHVVAYMNQKQNIYYSLMFGDKDTFALACHALNENCSFVPYGPLLLGKSTDQLMNDMGYGFFRGNRFRGYSFLQPDMEGRPFCVHLSEGGKMIAIPFLEKGRRLFTYIRSYDPNRAHLAPIKALRDVVVDEGDYYAPLYETDKALGSFEETLVKSFKEAAQFIREAKKKKKNST